MQDWNSYGGQLAQRIGEFSKLNPDTMAGVAKLGAAVAKPGHLDVKTHELIALAVAVTTRCDGCIASHTQKAINAGASREEIAEALGVAIALNAGAALVYSARVLDAHHALTSAA